MFSQISATQFFRSSLFFVQKDVALIQTIRTNTQLLGVLVTTVVQDLVGSEQEAD